MNTLTETLRDHAGTTVTFPDGTTISDIYDFPMPMPTVPAARARDLRERDTFDRLVDALDVDVVDTEERWTVYAGLRCLGTVRRVVTGTDGTLAGCAFILETEEDILGWPSHDSALAAVSEILRLAIRR